MPSTYHRLMGAQPINGQPFEKFVFSQTSYNSSRGPDGKLKLEPHHWSLERRQIWGVKQYGMEKNPDYYPSPSLGEGYPNSPAANYCRDQAYARAYAKFRGKLYKGGAALGVTAASYRQSREMIVTRGTQLATLTGAFADKLSSNGLRGRHSLHNTYLEYLFGAKPLAQDMWAAANTVIQKSPGEQMSIRSSAQMPFAGAVRTYYRTGSYSGRYRVTIAANVQVSNPNLWLAERAGLANPASVAWDLVPWSFVANQICSIGAIVNSITDFVGLSFGAQSVTNRGFGTGWNINSNGLKPTQPGSALCYNEYSAHLYWRSVGAIPSPPLVGKLPDVNWELAAMAGSLVIQKVHLLNRVLTHRWR